MSDQPHHFVTAACALCGNLTSFDPARVPTIHGDPMCRDCTIKANGIRDELHMGSGRWHTDESIWQPVEGLPE